MSASATSSASKHDKIECIICMSKCTPSAIKKCIYCDFECCSTCLKYHVETTLKVEKNCMNCKKRFTRITLINLLGKSYIDKLYRGNIKELVFKEEKMLIPRSLPELERRKKINIGLENVKNIEKCFADKISNGELKNDSIEYYEEKYKVVAHRQYFTNVVSISRDKKDDNLKMKQYKFPCENNECPGFVNTDGYCSLCEKTTCKHCHLIKEDNHVCEQGDIDTAILIKKDSKPCPKCNISIMKSSGCDQMWCVSCHTTFDWKTLVIKTSGVLHNPEYFRYMRDHGVVIPRNPNDNPCEDNFANRFNILTNINRTILDVQKDKQYHKNIIKNGKTVIIDEYMMLYVKHHKVMITSDINKLAKEDALKKLEISMARVEIFDVGDVFNSTYISILFGLYREINHIELVELHHMREKIEDHANFKDRQRLMYLEKNITEEVYKRNLMKRLKEIEFLEESIGFNTTISEVCKAFFINTVDNLQDVIDDCILKKIVPNICKSQSFKKLKEFIADIKKNSREIKDLYGYTRIDFMPSILS